MATIALLTDFGYQDWFVGSMKGVIAGIDPDARVVDITHGIKPGDIRSAAFALKACVDDFPLGTIFVAVVDPGVGSSRKALVVRAGNVSMIGPDNGVLSYALDKVASPVVHSIENDQLMRQPVSQTFHGRDVFATAAAHLGRGVLLEEFGPNLAEWKRLSWPASVTGEGKLVGETVYIDRFGNAISSIQAELLHGVDTTNAVVQCRALVDIPVRRFYTEVGTLQPVALVGSSGLLELSINGGNAAASFGLKVGDRVEVFYSSGMKGGGA